MFLFPRKPQALLQQPCETSRKFQTPLQLVCDNSRKGKTPLQQTCERDDAITGIDLYLDALSRHNDIAIRTNANVLLQEIKLYGTGIARLSYQNETATITSIVDKFNNDVALKAAVMALPLLPDWVAALKTANSLFDTKYVARAVEQGAASPDTIRAKRLEAMQAYYDLRDMINGYATTTKGAVPYSATIDSINALVDDYNTTINQRAALAAKAKSGDQPATDN